MEVAGVMGRLKEFCIPLVFWSAVWMSYASVALGADCSNQLSPILFGKYIFDIMKIIMQL